MQKAHFLFGIETEKLGLHVKKGKQDKYRGEM